MTDKQLLARARKCAKLVTKANEAVRIAEKSVDALFFDIYGRRAKVDNTLLFADQTGVTALDVIGALTSTNITE